MLNDGRVILIPIVLILFMAILLIVVMTIDKKQRKGDRVPALKHKKAIGLVIYNRLNRFSLSRRYLERIRRRIEMLELSDGMTISLKTIRFSAMAMAVSGVLVVIVLALSTKPYFILIGCLTVVIIHQQILTILIERMDDKLLLQFEHFLGDVRHHFHEHGMIDEAIYDAVEEGPHEIGLHAQRMYEILTDTDAEKAMSVYYDLVPNKYFKTFLTLCYTVQKFGDRIVDGQSMFLQNMNYLKQEINLEVLKRRQIQYLFKSLTLIALLPIFSLTFIENWAESNMTELSVYYDGIYGFYVQIGLFAVVMLAYQMLNKLQIQSDNQPLFGWKIEARMYRTRAVADLIRKILNKNYAKVEKKALLLKNVGARIPVELYYLKRILYGSAVFVVAVIVLIYGNHVRIDNLTRIMPQQESIVDLGMETVDYKSDAYWIEQFRGGAYNTQMIYEAMLEDGYRIQIAQRDSERVFDKMERIKSVYFKWYWLLPCFLIAYLGFHLPDWILAFRKSVLQMIMEDEVLQFHTIILMLMHIERMSVEDILEWMGMFAEVFKSSIHRCLNEFEQGDIEALEQLKCDEPFLPFVRIVENLQAACDRVAIMQAFDELKIERSYYQEKRKQDNQMMIEKKSLWGRTIAFTPMGGTVLFYIIVPFIHLSVTQFTSYSQQIQQFL